MNTETHASMQDKEREHYWNNVDPDGESLSECASIVFQNSDEDENMSSTSNNSHHHPKNRSTAVAAQNEQSTQPSTEKKKRVRKKKKKKDNNENNKILESTPEGQNENAVCHTEEKSKAPNDLVTVAAISASKEGVMIPEGKNDGTHDDNNNAVTVSIEKKNDLETKVQREKSSMMIPGPEANGSVVGSQTNIAWNNLSKKPPINKESHLLPKGNEFAALPQSLPTNSMNKTNTNNNTAKPRKEESWATVPTKTAPKTNIKWNNITAGTKDTRVSNHTSSHSHTPIGTNPSSFAMPKTASWGESASAKKSVASTTMVISPSQKKWGQSNNAYDARTLKYAATSPKYADGNGNKTLSKATTLASQTRPKLAVQEAFWPSLGNDDKKTKASSSSAPSYKPKGVWASKAR